MEKKIMMNNAAAMGKVTQDLANLKSRGIDTEGLVAFLKENNEAEDEFIALNKLLDFIGLHFPYKSEHHPDNPERLNIFSAYISLMMDEKNRQKPEVLWRGLNQLFSEVDRSLGLNVGISNNLLDVSGEDKPRIIQPSILPLAQAVINLCALKHNGVNIAPTIEALGKGINYIDEAKALTELLRLVDENSTAQGFTTSIGASKGSKHIGALSACFNSIEKGSVPSALLEKAKGGDYSFLVKPAPGF